MLKDKFQGIVIGATVTALLMSTIPVLAKSAQEAIMVTYNNIKIVVDGKQVQTENEPFIYNGRTYLPVRDTANVLGKEVTWDGNSQTVFLGVVPENASQTPVVTQPEQQQQSTSESEYNLPQGSKVISAYYADSKVMKDGNSGKFLNQLYIEFELNGKTYYIANDIQKHESSLPRSYQIFSNTGEANF